MSPRLRLLVHALFLLSGATALVYQVTWVRNLSLIFGASHQATSIVLASFMAGLALGGAAAGRRAGSLARPLRGYGWLEIGIALSALALPLLLRGIDAAYVAAAQRAGEVTLAVTLMRIALSFAALALPTFLMGATLPVLVQFSVDRSGELGPRLGWLYGINTLGAAAGAITAGFALIPALGVWRTQLAAVAVNLAVGAAALLADARLRGAAVRPAAAASEPAAEPAPSPAHAFALRLAFLGTAVAGACALALEVLWTRAIAIAVGGTVYSFTVMLAAFLVGIWLGSWLQAALPLRRVGVATQMGATLVAIGVASWLVSTLIPRLPQLMVELNFSIYADLQRVRPGTTLLVAFAVMLVPCVFMGVAFPLAGRARALLRAGTGEPVGDTVGLNTLGSIAGSLAAGFVLIPRLGLQDGMLLAGALDVAWGSLVLAAALAAGASLSRGLAFGAALAAAAGALALPFLAPAWNVDLLGAFASTQMRRYVRAGGRVDVAGALGGHRLLYFAEGRTSTISVVERRGHRSILVNGRAEASDFLPDLQVEYLLGHVPMLLHPAPRSALVVGLGAGITLGAVAAHPDPERITLVEIEPVVLGGTRRFSDLNDAALDDPRLEIVFQDGRNFLKTTPRRFDVITSDPIYPWNAGSGYLYTTEYYALAAARLAEGGVMCQWWPASDLSNDDFRALVRSFAAAFAHTTLWQSTYDVVLIGSNRPIRVDPAELARRIAQPGVARQLARVGLDAPLPFLAEFALDDAGVRRYIEGAPWNTDDNLYLEFSSPLAIGAAVGPSNVLSIDAYRTNPAAILARPEPLFASREEAKSTLARYQAAKQATSRIFFGARSDHFARVSESLPDASRRLRAILRDLPEYGPARVQLANNLAQIAVRRLEQDRPQEALAEAQESVELVGDAQSHHVLGTALARLGRPDEAIPHFEAALGLRPWYWLAYAELAGAYHRSGRTPDAIRTLREGLAIEPDNAVMAAHLRSLLADGDVGARSRRSG
jgi:spermidine synthase